MFAAIVTSRLFRWETKIFRGLGIEKEGGQTEYGNKVFHRKVFAGGEFDGRKKFAGVMIRFEGLALR